MWFLRYPRGQTDTQTDILITILRYRSRGRSIDMSGLIQTNTHSCQQHSNKIANKNKAITIKTLEQRCFPNINLNRTQAAEIDLDLHTRPSEGPNTSSV